MSSTKPHKHTPSSATADTVSLNFFRDLAPNYIATGGEATTYPKLEVIVPADLAAQYDTGSLFSLEGLPEEARSSFQALLPKSKNILGKKHPFVFMVTNCLGYLYAEQKDYTSALQCYEKTLSGREMLLGQEHTWTLKTVQAIAQVYHRQGKLDESIRCFERVRLGLEAANGPDHVDTLEIVAMIGVLYSSGNYPNGIEYNEKALERVGRILGTEHRATFIIMHSLAKAYQIQGKHEKAQEMSDRVKAALRKAEMKNRPVNEGSKRKTMFRNIVLVCAFIGLIIARVLYSNKEDKAKTEKIYDLEEFY